jgi:hypothetical protein
MSQTSLRELNFCPSLNIQPFTSLPGAIGCLENLSKLCCDSNIYPEFFYKLSQICNNLQSLKIEFGKIISNGLADLISVQKNLKHLEISQDSYCKDLTDIITSLTKLSNSVTKLYIRSERYLPLSFIAKFIHLQEILFSFHFEEDMEDFETLQNVTFPQLQILKFPYGGPYDEPALIEFLEYNGNNLKEFYIGCSSYSLNLAISEFCPNLRKLFIGYKSTDDSEELEEIFDSCQQLESINFRCGSERYLSEKDLLEVAANYSPINVHELKLCYDYEGITKLLPEELESFFINWADRIPLIPLTFIVFNNNSYTLIDVDENMELFKKYIKLGVIKELQAIDYSTNEFEITPVPMKCVITK